MLAQATIEKGALDSLVLGATSAFQYALDSFQERPIVWLVAAVVLCALLLRPRNKL